MGILEEGVKTASSVVDAMRSSPLALANIVLNICFLVFIFWYVSRISDRAESTVKQLFQAQDNLYKQWAVMIKDQQDLMEKSLHCISVEDAMKLLQVPARPAAPEPMPRAQSLKLPPLPPLPPKTIEIRQ
jgi:hypothetical protein